MSHAQILNLLHREANQMSGYGYGFECPHCEGSGLIGGFAGQSDIYAKLDEQSLTGAQRKELKAKLFDALAGDKEKARRKAGRTAEQRVKAAKAILARNGVVVKREKGASAAANMARALKILGIDEGKVE